MRYLLFALALIGTISVATATYADPGNGKTTAMSAETDRSR